MLLTNYHTHSRYDDGQAELEDYIRKAIDLKFDSIGLSNHAPIPYANEYAMHPVSMNSYVIEFRRLKEQYGHQIDMNLGLEVDIIPGLQDYFMGTIVPRKFDYLIGSVHFIGTDPRTGTPWEFDAGATNFEWGWNTIYEQNIRQMVEEFYQCERLVPSFIPGISIVGHMDRIKRFNYENRYFDENDSWYRDVVEETLEVYATANIVVELNTAGWRTPTKAAYPSPWICRRCHELGIRMHVNTDAHLPAHINSDYNLGVTQLQEAGYKEVWMRREGKWIAQSI
jgi:histidinol-phosphatase (PHP family)